MSLYDKIYNYVLWQHAKIRSGKPKFLPTDTVPNHGFFSIYNVTKETAEALERTGNTRDFKGVVWSRRLWIDVDSYELAEQLKARLERENLDFVCYDSGHRGYHFGILRRAEPSHVLPLQDKEWVVQNAPEADIKLYSQLHLLRCIGARHEKTGRPKTAVVSRSGREIDVTGISIEKAKGMGLVVASANSIFNDFYIQSLTVPQENGKRHPSLVKLAYAIKKRGEPIEIACWYLLQVNLMYKEPKDEKEVEKIVQDAYKD